VEGDSTTSALERLRTGLHLEHVALRGPLDGRDDQLLAATGPRASAPVALDVRLPDGYHLIGRGPEVFAPDPDFLTSLGAAAVRAFEGERLQAETVRNEQLTAIDRSRTALLASVGHDLRTPLASLRVSVETLQAADAVLTDQDREALLGTIESATDRLDDLITNLLDMSRLQAGAVPVHLEPTDLVDVVDRVLVALPSARIVVELEDGLPAVIADPALLERVIVNLASNALRYSPSDEEVRVSARNHGGEVQVDVEDRGPGIPVDQTETVFAPFNRAGRNADGGTGLGLAIVRGFTEAMGMDVALTPAPGGGLLARITMQPWRGTSS
jgi:two-component system sensor histidine kinase KdpD